MPIGMMVSQQAARSLLQVSCLLFLLGVEAKEPRGCSPFERRALAEKGDNATLQEWDQLTACIAVRNRNFLGHFAMHISKSGGTSMCAMYKDNKCKTGTHSNCLSTNLNMGPMWVRKSKAGWARGLFLFDEKKELKARRDQQSCENLRKHMQTSKQMLVMDERYLPPDSPCSDFMNVVIIREPVRRIVSHYGEILNFCKLVQKRQKGLQCERFFASRNGTATTQYNITYLSQVYDLVSDNYITRSFNDVDLYAAPLGLVQNSSLRDAMLARALRRLQQFEWVLVLDSRSASERSDNDLIVIHGLGLLSGMKHVNQARRGVRGLGRVAPEFRQDLVEMNALDYAVWAEAQRLHALDVESLRRMAQARKRLAIEEGEGTRGRGQNRSTSRCCGRVCRPALDKTPSTLGGAGAPSKGGT